VGGLTEYVPFAADCDDMEITLRSLPMEVSVLQAERIRGVNPVGGYLFVRASGDKETNSCRFRAYMRAVLA
jgi:hypothetical protein